jgi:hypothetical protein
VATGRGYSQLLSLLSGASYIASSIGHLQHGRLLSTRPTGQCLLLLLVSFKSHVFRSRLSPSFFLKKIFISILVIQGISL